MKQANCTTHDPNIPESFDNKQKPIQLKRLRGTTDEQTKAWAEHAWSLSSEGKSGQKATFTVEKKAYILGFVKAAEAAGLSTGQATDLLCKTAGWFEPYKPGAADIAASFVTLPPINGLAGLIGGAGVGGVAGYLGGRNKRNPEQDHSIRDSVLGSIAGAGLGGIGGVIGTEAYLANKHPEIFNRLMVGAAGSKK